MTERQVLGRQFVVLRSKNELKIDVLELITSSISTSHMPSWMLHILTSPTVLSWLLRGLYVPGICFCSPRGMPRTCMEGKLPSGRYVGCTKQRCRRLRVWSWATQPTRDTCVHPSHRRQR